MEVLAAHTPLRLEEEGVKGFEEWLLKKVTPHLAQKWREVCSRQMQDHGQDGSHSGPGGEAEGPRNKGSLDSVL